MRIEEGRVQNRRISESAHVLLTHMKRHGNLEEALSLILTISMQMEQCLGEWLLSWEKASACWFKSWACTLGAGTKQARIEIVEFIVFQIRLFSELIGIDSTQRTSGYSQLGWPGIKAMGMGKVCPLTVSPGM
jgi:hypothetical protein